MQLVFVLAVLLGLSLSLGADDENTEFSGFAFWTHGSGEGQNFNIALEQVWLQGERDLNENILIAGTMAVAGQPRLVHDFKLVWFYPLEKVKDWNWLIDKITVGRFIPPLGREWTRFNLDEFETIRSPTQTRWLVTRDDGIQVDGVAANFKWVAGVFGAGERVGGLLAERYSGRWHYYAGSGLDLDKSLTIGGGIKLSLDDRATWDFNVVYQTEKAVVAFEEVGYRDAVNPSEKSYLAAYSLTDWLRLVGRYEDRYSDLNHFTTGVRLVFDNGEVKSNLIWPQGQWDNRLVLSQFVLRF